MGAWEAGGEDGWGSGRLGGLGPGGLGVEGALGLAAWGHERGNAIEALLLAISCVFFVLV